MEQEAAYRCGRSANVPKDVSEKGGVGVGAQFRAVGDATHQKKSCQALQQAGPGPFAPRNQP